MDFIKSTFRSYIPNLKFEYSDDDEVGEELDTFNLEQYYSLPSLLTPCGFGMLNSNNDNSITESDDDSSNYHADTEHISDYELDLYTDDDYYVEDANVNIDDKDQKVYYDNFSEDSDTSDRDTSDTCTEFDNTNNHINNNHHINDNHHQISNNHHINNNRINNNRISNNHINNNHINNNHTTNDYYTINDYINNTNNHTNNHHTTNDYYTTINDYITKDYTTNNDYYTNYANNHATYTHAHANNYASTNNYANHHATYTHAHANNYAPTNNYANHHAISNHSTNNYITTTNNHTTNNRACANNYQANNNYSTAINNYTTAINNHVSDYTTTNTDNSDNDIIIKMESPLSSITSDYIESNFTNNSENEKIIKQHDCDEPKLYSSMGDSRGVTSSLAKIDSPDNLVDIKIEPFDSIEEFYANHNNDYLNDGSNQNDLNIKTESFNGLEDFIKNYEIKHHGHEALEQSDDSDDQFIGLNIQPCLGSSIILPGSSNELPVKNVSDLSYNYDNFIEDERLNENSDANIIIKLEEEEILYSYSESNSEFSSEETDLESCLSGEESILSYDNNQNNDTYPEYTNLSDLSGDDNNNCSNFEYYDNKVLKYTEVNCSYFWRNQQELPFEHTTTTTTTTFESTISKKKRKYDDSNDNDVNDYYYNDYYYYEESYKSVNNNNKFYYNKLYNRTLHKKRRTNN